MPTILAVVAIVALAIAIVYEPAALPPNVAKYKAQQLEATGRPELGRTYAFDGLSVGTRQSTIGSAPIAVSNGQRVSVVGWALDPRTLAPVTRLTATLDRQPIPATVVYAIARPDVASALREPNAAMSGFRASVFLANVAPGHHALTISVVGAGKDVTALPTAITLDVARNSSVTKRPVVNAP